MSNTSPDDQPELASKTAPNPVPRPPSGNNRRGAIAGLIIAIVILGVGWWLARSLTAQSRMQDCLMSGRTNCNVIEPAR